MRRGSDATAREIIDVVIDLIETQGYDAVQVRTVARSARVSLTTLYKLFGTRDELIVKALERWMDEYAYAALTMPERGESAYDTLVRVARTVFEPWEQHPRMLAAYHRAQTAPGGRELDLHGMAIVRPIAEAALRGADPEYLRDLELVLRHVERTAIARFADGEIPITDILPIMERTLFRLTADNRLATVRRSPQRPRTASEMKPAAPRRSVTNAKP